MRVSIPLSVARDDLSGVADAARAAEEAGADSLSCSELKTDPLFQLVVAAGATQRIGLMSHVVVAFARSPMTLAQQAWSLQEYSGGRLVLGLGSQIKAHIERRFSMPWSAPAARMAEYVAALRTIWTTWHTGERLNFQGTFYRHTLMTPMFTPTGTQPMPKIYLAAVGERMTEVAGEVADGLFLHPFTTPKYVREVTLPAVERGKLRSTSKRDVVIDSTSFLVTGRTEEEVALSRKRVREQLAFYGSTPAYRPVLDAHGWGELGERLHALSISADAEKWVKMGALIPEEVLAEFAVVAPPDEIGSAIQARWGELSAQCQLNSVGVPDAELVPQIARAIQEA